MKRNLVLLILSFCSIFICTRSNAQLWTGVLQPTSGTGACSYVGGAGAGQCAIDWSTVGVPGGIPNRSTICTTSACAAATAAGSSATLAQLNAALSSCPSGQVVLLASGTYNINGTLSVPGNCTLRGGGTLSTILNTTGTSGAVIQLGTTGPISSQSTNIQSGATAGSTSIAVASAANIAVGGYLMITELNDPRYVTISTPNGICTWCDASMWGGARVRGQIVEVEGISGNTVTISPALYTNYGSAPGTSPALASPFAASAKYAGVESLQVYANNTGYSQTFSMVACAYCWIKGVFDNYTDGDHVDDYFGFHDEIRDSYFSNAYSHTAGSSDSDISLLAKTSGTLVENNILERLHVGVLVDWGSAGNVIGYNYSRGNFDSSGNLVILASFGMHGAHPQFNLFEGNVGNNITYDSFWGSGSNNTTFRNQFRATDSIATPLLGRGVINWAGAVLANSQMFALTNSFPHTNVNSVGNILGSADAVKAASLGLYNSGPTPFTSTVIPSATRNYMGWFYATSAGYDTGGDANGSIVAAFAGGPSNKIGYWVGLASASIFQQGNFDIGSNSVIWSSSGSQTLPASFYKNSQPSWFGSAPWPPMGPDVAGGNVDASTLAGHVYAIPAESCYESTARDSFGLLQFNPANCYGGSVSGTPPPSPTGLTAVVH
jgi:hypothetical protein